MPTQDHATHETCLAPEILCLAKIIMENVSGPGKITKDELLMILNLYNEPDLSRYNFENGWYGFITAVLNTFQSRNGTSPPIENVIAKLFDDSGYAKCSGDIRAHFEIETPTAETTHLQAAGNCADSRAQIHNGAADATSTSCRSHPQRWIIPGICAFCLVAGISFAVYTWKFDATDKTEFEIDPNDVQELSTVIISEVTHDKLQNLRNRKPGYSLSFQAFGLSPPYIYKTFYAMKDGVLDLTINCDIFFAHQENCVDMSHYQDYDSIIEMTKVKNIALLRPNPCFLKSNMTRIIKFTENLQNAKIGIGDDAIIRKITGWLNDSSPGVNINSE